MKASARVKSVMPWVGGLLSIGGVGFMAERLWFSAKQMDLSALGGVTWAALGLLSLIYGFANILLALSWRELLKYFGVMVPRSWAVWAFGVSQIAKYIPGNIFHLAGRQALGIAAGYPHRSMAISAVWELGLIAMTGVLFGALALPLLVEHFSLVVSVCSFAALLVGFALGLWHFFGVSVARAMLLHAWFLLASGLVFVGLVTLLVTEYTFTFGNASLLVGAFVLAWLIGLATPGAPAGIGVRELVLLFLLDGQIPVANLVLTVGLGRCVTAVGDVLFFFAAALSGGQDVQRDVNI